MSQDLALQDRGESNILSILDELISVIETTRPHENGYEPAVILSRLEELRGSFEDDYKRMSEIADLMFGEDLAAYGARCTAVFQRWDEESGGPSLLAMIAQAWDRIGLPQDDALVKVAVMAAVLAEVPNSMQYHGNAHYRKVLFHVIRLIGAHNIVADKSEHLSEEDMAIMLIAGAIHDLGHEGGDNLRDGIYTPGYMEQKAFDMARPYFEELGLSRDQLGVIETLVFCTDITFFAGDNSPCVRMRRIFSYYFENSGDEKVLDYMMGKLRRFEENRKLSLMAMLLHEADVGTSAGLSYEQSIKETIDIIEERGMKTAGPKVLLAFMQEQLGGSMKTQASKAVFGPAMEVILDHARQDMERGRETFYEGVA